MRARGSVRREPGGPATGAQLRWRGSHAPRIALSDGSDNLITTAAASERHLELDAATTVAAEPPAARGGVPDLDAAATSAGTEQFREPSFTSRRSQYSLLMEGLDIMFERHGKPPIARPALRDVETSRTIEGWLHKWIMANIIYPG
jgi:hypothetical protein